LGYFFIFLVLVLIVLVVVLLTGTIKIIKQSEVAIVERLGKYNRKLNPGIHYVIPVFDRILDRIDMRTQVLESPSQSVITKDNVGVEISTVTWYRIVDPSKSVYEIGDLKSSIFNIIATTLRDVIGQLELDDTYSSRDVVKAKLGMALDEATNNWGIKVERVEVKDINPPKEIKDAMEKQMKAERERRELVIQGQGRKESQILDAEGLNQSIILEATANKQSKILEAEGVAESIRLIASADQERIGAVYGALKKVELTQEILDLESILSLKEIAKSDNKMMVPYESTKMLGSIAQLIETKNFSEVKTKKETETTKVLEVISMNEEKTGSNSKNEVIEE
jgi:regulator of protease activity HflC (stomatin/prohibitin superfamily)